MKNRLKRGLITTLLLILALNSATFSVDASRYQKCYKDNNCTIGEFLYDDSYVPIATANCVLTSRFPDGTIFLNSVDMDSHSDGWYSYTFVATGSAGLYRSTICCTAGADYLCLDKSFEIEASPSALTKADVASAVWDAPRSAHNQPGSFGQALQNIVPSTADIASAIWGYSNRTLTSFGSLPTDIWNVSTRTLTSFSDLIQSIWNHNQRTLTKTEVDTSNLAKKSDVEALKKEVIYNQTLLEKMVNKPIIKNFLEAEKDVNLESKLNQSQLYLTRLFNDSYSLASKLSAVDLKWKEYDEEKITQLLKEINKLNASIDESAKKIKGLWNFELATNLVTLTKTLKNKTAIIENDLKVEGKSRIVLADFRSLNDSLDGLINIVGLPQDKPEKNTLYAKINEIKTINDNFDLYSSEVDKLLADWKKYQSAQLMKKIDELANNLAKINRLPKTITVVSAQPDDDLNKKLKNRLLSIKAAINANKILLAKATEKPFTNSWVEEGSIVFKTLLTNPSERISQEVPLKYYLPPEVKKENIISVDEGLKVDYDVEKKQLFVEGNFVLGPGESKVVAVRVEDIWTVSDEEIASLRRQAADLLKPLEKTSYFGQGVMIKSNIDVALDKVLTKLKSAVTPESKIQAYYEAQIEIKGVKDQIKSLQDLVTQAGSFGSMAGFVGGAQAVAVWGLIIIMVTGFVFLVIYMRVLQKKEPEVEKKAVKKDKKTKKIETPTAHHGLHHRQMIRLAAVFFILGSVVSSFVSFAVFKAMNSRTLAANLINNSQPTKKVFEKEKIVSPVPENSVLGEETKAKKEEKMVEIIDLGGDFLRVRQSPNGPVIGKVYSGEKYRFIEERDGWVAIEFEGKIGWIAKEFTSLK